MPAIILRSVRAVGVPSALVRRVAGRTLRAVGLVRARIGVHFVGDRRMRTINARYRGCRAVADVLSFPTREGIRAAGQDYDLGDVVLCAPQLRRQAKKFGARYADECVRMLIHGILHLAGHSHRTRHQAARMFALQERLVRSAGGRPTRDLSLSH